MRPFGEAQRKAVRAYAQSRQYHTIVESRVRLTETSVKALLNRTTGRILLKRKSDYVKTLIPKKGLNKIWKKMIELEKPMMKFNPYGGRMGEIASKCNSTLRG